MTESPHHPAPEQLDRLRAGLLDNETDTVTNLEAHISGCQKCQRYLEGWTQLQKLAEDWQQASAQLATRLKKARSAALRAPSPVRNRFTPPALAIAASLMLVVGLVLWNPWSPVGIVPDQMAQHQEDPEPDLYEELDFYIWLAGHQESAVSKEFTMLAQT